MYGIIKVANCETGGSFIKGYLVYEHFAVSKVEREEKEIEILINKMLLW